jgi:3-deoxy-manno-octulosonate cytidylyltransferase (CMP-KDO synthetase)
MNKEIETSVEIVALIPARYGSTRFPGKPLALLRGKPMIQHVYEHTCRARGLARVLVATDDDRIADAVRAIGGEVVMTRADHPTGTDRLAEVAHGLTADMIVNVQGDLPFFPPSLVEDAVAALTRAPAAVMATVKTPIHDLAEWRNINVVKVVTDREGFALYFSRSPIPYLRDQTAKQYVQNPKSKVQNPKSKVQSPKSKPEMQSQTTILGYRHIGLYVYRRDFLLTFPRLARTPLEQSEQLEQLRALEWGYRIVVSETERPTIEVDTPEDLQRAEEALS